MYDSANVAADLEFNSATGQYELSQRYLRGDATDQLFARLGASGSALWYVTDRMGSVRNLVTAAEQNVVLSASYTAFGQRIISGVPVEERYGYTGREYDVGISPTLQLDGGLQYSRARYYDPQAKRWISQDPLGLAPDTNPYRYAGNSPTNFTDPSGLFSILGNVNNGWFAEASNFGAGLGDTISFGITGMARQLLGIDYVVNRTGWAYNTGVAGGAVFHAAAGNPWGVGFAGATLVGNYADWSIKNPESEWSVGETGGKWLRLGATTAQAVTGVIGGGQYFGAIASYSSTLATGLGIGGLGMGVPLLARNIYDYFHADWSKFGVVDHLQQWLPLVAGLASIRGAKQSFQRGYNATDEYFITRTMQADVEASLRLYDQLIARGTATRNFFGAGETVSPPVLPQPPRQLAAGRAFEAERLAAHGVPKNTEVFRPTLAETESAAFKVIVGKPKFTPEGELVGTIFDVTQAG